MFWYLFTILYGVTFHKTIVLIFTTVRISYLTKGNRFYISVYKLAISFMNPHKCSVLHHSPQFQSLNFTVFSHMADSHYSGLNDRFLSVILATFYSLIGPHTLLIVHSPIHKKQVGPDKNNENTSLEYVCQHGLFMHLHFLFFLHLKSCM